ncbi:hypothetical protein J2T17_000809 [Paenibacillus mucilaginosus]|uniref:hypothetical protein n=1 Tax=Paenibacillus mucilaginosus TaxID=61624 RepID=UPI003D1E128A
MKILKFPKHAAALYALGFILNLFLPSTGYACSCMRPQSVQAEFDRSEAVFAGRVLEVKEQRSFSGSLTKAVLFDVNRIWKGGQETQIMVHTGGGGGDCGYDFEEGRDYLVYANPSDMYGSKKLVTIICDLTKELVLAQEDAALLGEGRLPTEQVDLKGIRSRTYWIIGFGAAVVAWFFCRVRRKRIGKSS